MEHFALGFFGRSLSPLFTKSGHGWIFPQGHKLNVAGTRWASYHQQTISPPNVYLSRNGLLFMLENAYGTLLHARTGALICILFAVYRRSWLGGTLYKEEIVIRPSNASSTSLPSLFPYALCTIYHKPWHSTRPFDAHAGTRHCMAVAPRRVMPVCLLVPRWM